MGEWSHCVDEQETRLFRRHTRAYWYREKGPDHHLSVLIACSDFCREFGERNRHIIRTMTKPVNGNMESKGAAKGGGQYSRKGGVNIRDFGKSVQSGDFSLCAFSRSENMYPIGKGGDPLIRPESKRTAGHSPPDRRRFTPHKRILPPHLNQVTGPNQWLWL